jgi:hypothetical protein
LLAEKSSGRADRSLVLRAPQEVSCTIHRVDKPGVVPEIDHVVSTDDRSRLDRALRLILPEHLVSVASNAEKSSGGFEAALAAGDAY